MVEEVKTLTFHGIDVVDVNVEVHISSGMPAFILVGLADKTIAESKERVRAAINSLGISLPAKRIVINLAPADILKEGSHFDLAIACCLLSAMEVISTKKLNDYIILGELSLDGTLRPVSGVLPAAIGANARNKGLICPKENGQEASWSGNPNIIAANNLIALVNHFKEIQVIPAITETKFEKEEPQNFIDIQNIKGLEGAKRALEIAAAGGHNILMSGAPGAGKSMLASSLPSILPPLSNEEMLECSMIYSVAGLISEGKLQMHRPFREPHHSCSMPAMVGGGMAKRMTPGEISLAHNGILFLDEFPEFPRTVIDALRQPLENKNILISRAGSHITFPANFQLIAAMNPCRCGYLDDESKSCNKAPRCAVDYQSKISGPIIDRMDINIDIPSISPTDISLSNGEPSTIIAKRVIKAREIQHIRYKDYDFNINA
jgi:magnesium chelatase family protein